VKKKNTKTNKKQTNKQTNKQTKKKSAIFDGKYVHMHNKYLLLFALGNGLISRARRLLIPLLLRKKSATAGNLELCVATFLAKMTEAATLLAATNRHRNFSHQSDSHCRLCQLPGLVKTLVLPGLDTASDGLGYCQ
jgi:hypothetical protein